MTRRLLALLCALVLSAVPRVATAQEPEDQTFLNWTQMRAIVSEASGDRALQHIIEFVPWPRIRPMSEFGPSANFRESVEMVKFAKDYGYDAAETESFPTGGQQNPPTQGELWMTAPDNMKIIDIHDVAISLGGGAGGDVSGDLIDVGLGRPEDFAGKDFRGKFVLRSAGGGNLAQLAPGAIGVVNYSTLRADDQPDMIMSGGGVQGGTNWNVSPRIGRNLAARLARGEKVSLRSIVKTQQFPGELEVVHMKINGDGSSNQSVMLSCHLYEGYTKQGANDNSSGCGLILEVGRTYIRLVKEGKLPKPKRDIHFIGGAEISGTTAWLNAHPDVTTTLIADLNYDMDALSLGKYGAYWTILRTPDSFPSFLNDLVASFVEFVGNTNRERIRFRSNGYGFSLPIVSTNGSHDPLYYVIDKYYGASDHAVFLGRGIPATMFNIWPDPFYHSSMDTPDKLDPTMLKRAVVVTTGAMTILATADDATGLRIAGEVLARGTARMGEGQRKGLRYVNEATDGPTLNDAYKEAKNAVRHQASIEKQAVLTSKVFYNDTAAGGRQLAAFNPLIDARATALNNEVTAAYRLRATQLKLTASEPTMTAMEQQTARLVVQRVPQAQGGPGGGGGFGNIANNPNIAPADRQALIDAQRKIPGHASGDMGQFMGKGGKTVLEIRDFVSGEFEPIPLADVLALYRAQEKVGLVKLIQQAPAAAARR